MIGTVRSLATLVPCALLAAALAGCSLLAPARAPAPSLFSLEPAFASAGAPGRASAASEIAIATPVARPGFEGRGMAYVTRAYEIRYFARHQWVEPPARLLAALLAQALERDGRFQVVPRGAARAPALRLETEIVALQQEFDVRPSRLRFTLRAQLVDAGAGHVLATTQLEALEPAESDDPYGGIVAANRAVGRVLEELAAWCATQRASAGGAVAE